MSGATPAGSAVEGDVAVAAPAGGGGAGDRGGFDVGEHGEEGGLADVVLPDDAVAGEERGEGVGVGDDGDGGLAGEQLVEVEHLLGGGREVAVEGVDGGPAALAHEAAIGHGAVGVGQLQRAREDGVVGEVGEVEGLVAGGEEHGVVMLARPRSPLTHAR
jgi:hypothetical protein